MKDQRKTKTELIQELSALRQRVADLEAQAVVVHQQDITEQEQNETELRSARREWENIFQAIGHPTLIIAPDHTILAANQTTTRVAGQAEEDLKGLTCHDIFHPEHPDRPPENCPLQAMLVSQQVETADMELEAFGGTFLVSCTPVLDEGGNLEKVIHIATDITDRVRAEGELLESQQMFQRIVENMPVMFDAFDENGVALLWNKECERVTGYSAKEIVGNPHSLELFYPDPAYRQRALEQAHEFDGQYRDWELETHCKDGQTRTIAWSNISRHHPIPGWWSWGIGVDVTERKRAEEALRGAYEQLNATMDALPDILFELDQDGRIVDFRAPRPELLYVPPSGFLNKRVSEILPKNAAAVIGQAIEQAIAHGRHTGSTYWLDKGGARSWFEVSMALKGGAAATGRRIIALVRDITDRVQAEEALRQRNRELALLNDATRALGSTLDLDRVLETVLEEVRRMLDVTGCSVWLRESSNGDLVCRHVMGSYSERVRGWRLPLKQGLVGWTAHTGECSIVPDALQDERHFKGVDEQTGLALRSILSVPLRVKNDVLGVLQAVDTQVDRFKPQDLALLEPLAASAAIAIENARLYVQARRDAETLETLLREVNHRVKNNLTGIVGMLYAARDHSSVTTRSAYRTNMDDLIGRVRGLATVHEMLSATRWTPLCLGDLVRHIIRAVLRAIHSTKRVRVDVSPTAVRVTPDEAHDLAMVFNELMTNAVKYGLGERDTGRVSVRIVRDGEWVQCEFSDDGPGYPDDVLRLERHGIGFDLIQTLVRHDLGGDLSLHNADGAVAVIRFKVALDEEGGG